MDRYWSPVVMLQNSPVPTVDETTAVLPEICFTSTSVRLCSIPLPVRRPPNVTEQTIRKTVLSMPVMPRVAIRESMSGLPVLTAVGPYTAIISPLKPSWKERLPENEPDTPEAISWMTWGCAYSATIPARNAAEKRVSRAGTFFTIRNPVNTGTRSSHGEMLKVPVSTSENVSTCDISGEWCMRLATRKTITATVMDGTVVRSI